MMRFVKWILSKELLCCAVLAVIGYHLMGVRRLGLALALFIILKLLVFRRKPSETDAADDAPDAKKNAPRRNLLKPMAISILALLVYTIVCYFAPVQHLSVEYAATEAVEVYTIDELGGFTIELPESLNTRTVKPAAGTDVVFSVVSDSAGIELEIDVYETVRDYEGASERELISFARDSRNEASSLGDVYSTAIVDTGAKRFVRYNFSLFGLNGVCYSTSHKHRGFMVSVFSDEPFSDSDIEALDQIVSSIRFSGQ